jgi:hypothetical protein
MYYVRVFSLAPIRSIARFQLWLAERGYPVRPAGTDALDILTDTPPLHVELTSAQHPLTQQEVLEFIEAVNARPDPNAVLVMDVLARTQAVIALHIPEEADSALVGDILDGCIEPGEGVIQVDGEGFYQDGVLILELI